MSKKTSLLNGWLLLVLALVPAGCSRPQSSSEKAMEEMRRRSAERASEYAVKTNEAAPSPTASPNVITLDDLKLSDEQMRDLGERIRAEKEEEEEEATRSYSAPAPVTSSGSYDNKAACYAALQRLNAVASQAGAAALGSSDQYYAWKDSHDRAQADVNTKCKASPGSGTYSGSSTYSGGKPDTSERDLHDARRREAAREGVALPPRP